MTIVYYYKLNDHDAWNGDDDDAGASEMSTTCCPWNGGALKVGRPIEARTSTSAVAVVLGVVVVVVVAVVDDDGAWEVEGFDTEAAVAFVAGLHLHLRHHRS